MKIRTGWVSNSSSSSFVIRKAVLSETLIAAIRDHENCGFEYADSDHWDITETPTTLEGHTWMDNFCMRELLINHLGIEEHHIEWGE